MMTEFIETTNIVDTTLQPRAISLSAEAQSALDSIVSVDEARRLLDQTGYGYLANIPLMIALSMRDSPENPYRIDHQALFDVFTSNGDRVRERIQKSYNEVVGMVNMTEVGNVQGVKLLTFCKKRLDDLLGVLGEGAEYALLNNVVKLFVQYLQIAYTLMGRQH